MNILHTLIVKAASAITAVFLFVGIGTQAPTVTVVDVQDNGTVTATTTQVQPARLDTIAPSPTFLEANIAPQTTVTPETPSAEPQTAPQTVYVPVYVYQTQEALPTAGGALPAPLPTQQQTPMEPTAPAQILVKSPLPGKGKLDRKYQARATPLDEINEIYLGAVLVRPDGSVENEADMEITATDASQNKTLEGTGNVSSFGDPNNPKHYYPFRYEFHTTGEHTITFKALGVETSVTINVESEDARPDPAQ